MNLALLQQFFSESELSGIFGDTLLPDPLRVRLPDLKIFQAEFSHEIEEDKRAKFDLGQFSNLTKKDEQAFASLAHSMVDDWQEYKGRSFENDFIFGSWKSWIMPGVGATAVLALIISVMLSYKLRALSSSLALLSLTNREHAMLTELNERIEYKLLSLTYKVLTTTQPSYLHNLIIVKPPRSTRSSSLVTLALPSLSSSLRITDRSFQYASPRLWNQLPVSLCQPRTNLSTVASPSSLSGTFSSTSSINSPLSSFITPSLFHSRLNTFLFCKFVPP